ncbi:MAG: HD domain-containing protein [Minisyncoccia bacterium]|jgi:putative hydrolase of HD superfamily
MKPEEIKRFLELQKLFDRMKTIRRKSMVAGREEMENDAEHSWHAAMWFMILADRFPKIDRAKVITMLLIHDLPELFSPEVDSYSKNEVQKAQEFFDGSKLFMDDVSEAIGNEDFDHYFLWIEFTSGWSAEAKIARAIDALQPMLQNINTGGKMWKKLGVTLADIDRIKRPVICVNETLTAIYEELFKQATEILESKKGE